MSATQISAVEVTRTLKIVETIFADLGTPYASRMLADLRAGDIRAVVGRTMPDPVLYTDPGEFAKDYLAYNLLRKSDFLDFPDVDRGQVALDGFLVSEQRCSVMNNCGKMWSPVDRSISTTSLEAVIHTARGLIANLLGPFSWTAASDRFAFTSGASTGHKRKAGDPYYKYSVKTEVTPYAAVPAICDIMRTPLWREHCETIEPSSEKLWVKIVPGSRIATVPKTWKTDRLICIEPEHNMRMQVGVGALLRSKLRKVGVDLNDQTWNQYLALIGSRTGSLCTVDLSSASDSVSLGLVIALLPGDWYEAIRRLRCRKTQLPSGEWHELEKVSSMGNGFTFELESLIFWALSRAIQTVHGVSDTRLAIYGDDIVVHNSVVEPLIEVLSYVGFETNKEKTFVSGPFRESCGAHWFYGVDVTPFNIKSVVESENRVYWFLNTYAEWCKRVLGRLPKSYHFWFRDLRKLVYKHQYCVVPPSYSSESGLQRYTDEANIIWSLRKQGFLFKAHIPVRTKRPHKPNGLSAVLAWFGVANMEDEWHLQKGDIVYRRVNRCTSIWPQRKSCVVENPS